MWQYIVIGFRWQYIVNFKLWITDIQLVKPATQLLMKLIGIKENRTKNRINKSQYILYLSIHNP